MVELNKSSNLSGVEYRKNANSTNLPISDINYGYTSTLLLLHAHKRQ